MKQNQTFPALLAYNYYQEREKKILTQHHLSSTCNTLETSDISLMQLLYAAIS